MLTRRLLHLTLATALFCGGLSTGPVMGWGSMAHGLFTGAALDRLPGPLGNFLRANRDFMVCYSVLPDDWWGSPTLVPLLPAGLEMPAGTPGRDEVDRHFLAVDNEVYSQARGPRSATLAPIDRATASALYEKYVAAHGQEALDKYQKAHPTYTGGLAGLPAAMFEEGGQVVWVIQERLADLAAAMKSGNWKRALLLATVLGHYVGDSHVPLHSATDHNGMFFPNPWVKGIHARWEARMLERNEDEVKKFLAAQGQTPRPAPLALDRVPSYVFKTICDSNALVDNLYAVDNELLAHAPPVTSTPDPTAVYTDEYFRQLYGKLGPSALARLWQSAEDVALFWNLAWEMAGEPVPPPGKIETPALFVIDFKHNRLVPYDPNVGPKE